MARIFLSAGEASGEHYGALLIESLRKIDPSVEIFGMGGKRMEDLGCRRIVRSEDMAVMGFSEVVRHLPRISSRVPPHREKPSRDAARRRRSHRLSRLPPSPGARPAPPRHPRHLLRQPATMGMEEASHSHQVKSYVDRMLVIFPFEEKFYRDNGVNATYVGHPLADLPLPAISRSDFADQYGLDASKDWVGLLPGSRDKEIRLNLPEIIKAAGRIEDGLRIPAAAGAPRLKPKHVRPIRGRCARPVGVRNSAHYARQRCTRGAPSRPRQRRRQRHRHRGSGADRQSLRRRLSRFSAHLCHRPPHGFGAVCRHGRTWLLDVRIVPELIQQDFTAANMTSHLRRLMTDETAREKMRADLAEVARTAACGTFSNGNGHRPGRWHHTRMTKHLRHDAVPVQAR